MTQAVITNIQPMTNIRRTRMLPIRGQVLVRHSQKVGAMDVVAAGSPGNEHLMLDLRSALNLRNPAQLEAALKCRAGEQVKKDDIIAESGGVFRRVVRAPVNGQIIAINAGQVMIQVQDHPVQLLAGISGTVVDVIPDRGVVLETNGSLVQGVWGNGKTSQGMLMLAGRSAEEEIDQHSLDVSMRGAVALGGWCRDANIFQAGNDLQLRGIILGSMPADLIPEAQKAGYPVLLVDGFGSFPMNSQAYQIFETNERQTACLHALPWNRFTGERPEVVIPKSGTGEPKDETTEIKAGAIVKVATMPLSGKVGIIVDLPQTPQQLPNGIKAQVARVRLENNELVSIPLVNLDVLE